MSIAALLLAAGASSRWGRPKALLPFAGTTLIAHLAHTALTANCTPIIRVLGAHRDAITATALATDGVTDIFNPTWADGMGNSIACGTRAALDLAPDLRGVIIIPCDQPLITAALLRQIAEKLSDDSSRITLCDYENGTLGPPTGFARVHFPALLALTGDTGARALTRQHPNLLRTLPFADARWDVDTPEEWAKFSANQERA